MATENKNSNIIMNLFHKGMNTDTTINMLDSEHYIYGKNVRITQTIPLGVAIDANRTKGCITPVPTGISKDNILKYKDGEDEKDIKPYSILATASVDNYGAVIIKDDTNKWYVYRVETKSNGGLSYTFIFTADDAITTKKSFSVVMSLEMKDVVKLYVATEEGIAQFNLLDEEYTTLLKSVNDAISNKLWPYEKPKILKKTGGSLPVGQAQWVYRLYKNHGQFSKLSTTTNKIQVFSANRGEVLGNELATVDDQGKLSHSNSGIGFQIGITVKKGDDYDFSRMYDHVQLFRIHYYTQDVIRVYLIQQAQLRSGQNSINILDDGIEPLQEYTLEEFSALEGLDLAADSIDTASQYMFAGNIEDKSSLRLDIVNKDGEEVIPGILENYPVLQSHTVSTFNRNSNTVHVLNDDGTEAYDRQFGNFSINKFDEGFFYNKGHKVNDIFEDNDNWSCHPVTHNLRGVYGGISPEDSPIRVAWRFVLASIKLHDNASQYNAVPNVEQNSELEFRYILDKEDGTTGINTALVEYSENGTGTDDESPSMYPTCSYYLNQSGIYSPKLLHYGDNITSSMFRSLRRGETYRYGIIYYNKYGQHTDVLWIDDIKVPSNYTSDATSKRYTDEDILKVTLSANPIGIEFSVAISRELAERTGIIKYQIVRCAHTKEFSKELYQVVQNAPIRCKIYNGNDGISPWSPVGTIQDFKFDGSISYFKDGFCQFINTDGAQVYNNNITRYTGNYLKILYGPDITYQRNSTLLTLKSFDVSARSTRRLVCQYNKEVPHEWFNINYSPNWGWNPYDPWGNTVPTDSQGTNGARRNPFLGVVNTMQDLDNIGEDGGDPLKNVRCLALTYYLSDRISYEDQGNIVCKIEQFEDVKNPSWEDNFTDVTLSDAGDKEYVSQHPADGAEIYKSFTTSLLGQTYNNWVCYGMYNMRCGINGNTDNYIYTKSDEEKYPRQIFCPTYLDKYGDGQSGWLERAFGHGWSGPGPVALIAAISKKDDPYWGMWGVEDMDTRYTDFPEYDTWAVCDKSYRNPYTLNTQYQLPYPYLTVDNAPLITTLIALEHEGTNYQGTTRTELQYDTYYGFGNYGEVHVAEEGEIPDPWKAKRLIVFDGDTYITPAEIQSMYKTWNKLSNYTHGIRSMSVINYIPIESEINSTLDYGENFKNTQNPNVQLEPYDIEGVGVQTRPQYQYNMVMSYNNYSAMSFTALSEDKVDENYPQRIFYSELKENGESVDNWGLFKALNYVDANTRYGEITNMLASKETLYFWLPNAFGKLSVNERSLITDENSNKIQLGTGGVLQRTDYISTDSGMKKDERAAITVGDAIYWIDSIRKSIMKYDGGRVINQGVQTATLNLLNSKFNTEERPFISYDVQNDEVLCKCLEDGNQIVYVHGLNLASSEYTREYQATISLHSVLYGLDCNASRIDNTQYNYLKGLSNFLEPFVFKFAINLNPYMTKVFDSLKIIVVDDVVPSFAEAFKQMELKYATDILDEWTVEQIDMHDREGEFQYAIPRATYKQDGQVVTPSYGNRARGKWMTEQITADNPTSDIAISQILTKVRTSFS